MDRGFRVGDGGDGCLVLEGCVFVFWGDRVVLGKLVVVCVLFLFLWSFVFCLFCVFFCLGFWEGRYEKLVVVLEGDIRYGVGV